MDQSVQIERIPFSKEAYHFVRDFKCKQDDDFSVRAESWIKGVPPERGAFWSIETHGTAVWIFILQDCMVGFSSLGKSKVEGKPIFFIPMFAISAAFQGKEFNGEKYSHYILRDTISESQQPGYDRVCLLVNKENERAKHLYVKFGFQTDNKELAHGNIRMCLFHKS